MIVHVHFDLDVRYQRLSTYDTGSRKRHLAAVHVDRTTVFLEMLVELIFAVDDHFAMAAYGTCRHLENKNQKISQSIVII